MPSPIYQAPLDSWSDLDDLVRGDEEQVVPDRSHLIGYSDLSRGGVDVFLKYWSGLEQAERISLVRSLLEYAEVSVDVDFRRVFRSVLSDDDSVVRELAIDGLWEDRTPDLAKEFLRMLVEDESQHVRAQAAGALLPFMVDFSDASDDDFAIRSEIVAQASGIATSPSEPPLTRRRCIEVLGPLASEPGVARIIEEAFADDDQTIAAGALRAMGHSGQSRWKPAIERSLQSDDAELRFEAAQAAGMLGEPDLVAQLAHLLDDEDAEVRFAAVGAIGRIGGTGAIRVLQRYKELDIVDGEVIELIDDAIDEARLAVDPLATD